MKYQPAYRTLEEFLPCFHQKEQNPQQLGEVEWPKNIKPESEVSPQSMDWMIFFQS